MQTTLKSYSMQAKLYELISSVAELVQNNTQTFMLFFFFLISVEQTSMFLSCKSQAKKTWFVEIMWPSLISFRKRFQNIIDLLCNIQTEHDLKTFSIKVFSSL